MPRVSMGLFDQSAEKFENKLKGVDPGNKDVHQTLLVQIVTGEQHKLHEQHYVFVAK